MEDDVREGAKVTKVTEVMQGAVGAVLPNERLSEVPEWLADELMAADEEFWVAYRDFLLNLPERPGVPAHVRLPDQVD